MLFQKDGKVVTNPGIESEAVNKNHKVVPRMTKGVCLFINNVFLLSFLQIEVKEIVFTDEISLFVVLVI